MLALLVVSVLAGVALGDVSTVMDEILVETRKTIEDNLPFVPLHYQHEMYIPETKTFRVEEELRGYNGQMELGKFSRTEPPQLSGDSHYATVETKFVIDVKVTYAQFKATNFTSGDSSKGNMLVSYQKAEMFSFIKIDQTRGTCAPETLTLMPISFDDPKADFTTDQPQLPEALFSNAKYDLNFYLNNTLTQDVWPKFEAVVRKSTALCELFV